MVHIFRFFHKDFILTSPLYSQTLFCHLAHFLRNFRKKNYPLPYKWTFFCYLVRFLRTFRKKNISTANIDTFLLFGPLIWKILQYFYTLYFLPWRCGYSRIAQTKRQRTKTFGLYRNSRAISLARLFFLFSLQNFLSAFLFSLTFGIPFNPYLPCSFFIFKEIKGQSHASFGLCALAPAARGKQKILEVNLNA